MPPDRRRRLDRAPYRHNGVSQPGGRPPRKPKHKRNGRGQTGDGLSSPPTAITPTSRPSTPVPITAQRSDLGRQAWRVRGVPSDFDKKKLANVLQQHSDMQLDEVDDNNDDCVRVCTLTPDLRSDQVATVRFRNLPTRLATLEQIAIDISTSPKNKLEIDRRFNDITVLFTPASGEHKIDVLAVCGLGGHAFGSFVHKDSGHMWLVDSLPKDMPTARVMTYGYESGLQGSANFANLHDLAGSLQVALSRVLHSEQKPLILIGHSLGGLLIKEALSRIAESDSDSHLINLVFGLLFFGVPNDGMDIESLIPMVGDQPNRFLLESLNSMNPQILSIQKQKFSAVLKRMDLEMFCFYETMQSPTAAKDATGQYKMNGPLRCLVTTTSATSCLPPGVSSNHSIAIHRTHSDLVKFASRDAEYDTTLHVLSQIHRKLANHSAAPSSQSRDTPALNTTNNAREINNYQAQEPPHHIHRKFHSQKHNAPYWIVPFGRNEDFVGREAILARLLATIPPTANKHNCQWTAIEGLGGVGKTQIALEAAFRVSEKHPDCSVFWVPAVDNTTFEDAYREIGRRLKIKGIDEDKADVKSLVKTALSQSADDWLLIIDNADDIELLVGSAGGRRLRDYLPFSLRGSILFTTRNHEVVRKLDIWEANDIRVTEMSRHEAVNLFQKLLGSERTSDTKGDIEDLLNILADLPLAIKQASAYIDQTGISVARYLDHCRRNDKNMIELLSKDFDDRGRYNSHQNPVATTWLISFRQITRVNQLAVQYLQFMSFVAEDIPKDLLSPGNSEMELDEAVGILKAYAFITERAGQGSYDMHRLVRLAMHSWLAQEEELKGCVTTVIQRLGKVFPFPTHENRAVWVGYLPHALTALDFRDNSTDEAANSRLLFNVAAANYELSKYEQAEAMNHETLTLRKRVLGADHPDTLRSRNNLANALHSQGKYEQAEAMHRETFTLQTRVLGADHPDTLRSRNNLANTLGSQGKHEQAEAMYRETLTLRTRVLGADHPDTLRSRNNLANALGSQGKYKQAEAMYRETLPLQTRVLGADHPDTLTSLNNLANALYRQGKYEQAEAMYRETLTLRTRVLSANHPDTLTSRNGLANTLGSQGKYEQAEAMYRETLTLRTRVLGADYPSTLRSRNGLVNALYSQGKREQAEAIRLERLQ